MNLRTITFAIGLMVCSTVMAQAPAFPGAEGHGRYVTGGRGGKVVRVTNLNDSGAGSLREAVTGSAKKIVVFDVAGVIALKKDLKIGANTTIEGQTAPSPGITIRYYTVQPSGNNIIIRFLRFRRGQEKNVNDGADAIWARYLTGIMIDHCSMSWSIDELASFYDNNNFTMQWCMLGEALANAGHGKGAHSYGGIWGGKLASFHHNYLGFMQNRVPRFNGARYNWKGYTSNSKYNDYKWKNSLQAENVDFRNCVMYNWGTGGCYGGPGGGYINIVNNYYKAGPGTKNKTRVTQVSVSDSGNGGSDNTFYSMTSRYYINGNYVTAASNPANYDWDGVKYDSGVFTIDGQKYTFDKHNYYGDTVNYKLNSNGDSCVAIKLNAPCAPIGEITTHTAEKAYNSVLSFAGASLYRDEVDARYVSDTKSGTVTYTGSNGTTTKGIIDFVVDCNGYTEDSFGTASRPEGWDTDGDGMPDEWEKANGLDLNDASDASLYTLDDATKGGKGWYTNIEVYCNSLVESIMKAENSNAISAVDEYYPASNTTTSIDVNVVPDNVPVSTDYYNMQGKKVVAAQAKGVLLKIETLKTGERIASKVIR